MKDIDSQLDRLPALRPRRGLSHDFTARTMERALDAPSIFGRMATIFQGVTYMHKLTKPAALGLAIAAVIAITGTGVASLLWLQPDVQFDKASGITTLENGNKRFWLNIGSCQGQHGGMPAKAYYEMRADSKTTINDMIAGLNSECEADLVQELFPYPGQPGQKADSAPAFKPFSDQQFYPYATFRGLDGDTMRVDVGLNGEMFKNVRVPIDTKAKFYEKGQEISGKDLRPGSFITLVIHTTALRQAWATESMTPDQIAPLTKDGLPIGARIKGAIQRVYNVNDAIKIQQTMGTDWSRLTPDKNVKGGWRQIVPLVKQ
jgi:hypothetical protein